MLVRFWGVRGSTLTPQPENLRYGGNTSCVEVRVNGHLYVFAELGAAPPFHSISTPGSSTLTIA